MFDLEDLYVADIIEPMRVYGSMISKFEESEVFKNCVCRKEIIINDNGTFVFYRDLKRDRLFIVSDEIGISRLDSNSIVPLSQYYNVFGWPKITKLKNKKSVRSKVKTLRKEKKL